MEQKNNITIAFTNEAESALLAIEKKYGLEENPEEVIKKIKEGKALKINIIAELSKEFFQKNILEKNFTDTLQKDLKMSSENAEKVFKDIVNNIMPFLKKISEEDIEKGIFSNQNQLPPTMFDNIHQPDKVQKIAEKMKPSIKVNRQNITRKKIKEIEKIVIGNVKKQANIYREKIE